MAGPKDLAEKASLRVRLQIEILDQVSRAWMRDRIEMSRGEG
jgi:hypothetical protein